MSPRERRYRFKLKIEGDPREPVCVSRATSKGEAKENAARYFRRVYQHRIGKAGGSYTVERVPDRPPRTRR